MRLLPRSVWRLGAGTVAFAAFAACSDSTSPSSTLTQAEANNVAEVVTTDAAQLPEGATFNSSTGVPFASGPMGAPVIDASAASCTPTKTPASPDALQFADTMQTDYTFATGATATHVRKWAASFTADQAGSIQMVRRCRAGP